MEESGVLVPFFEPINSRSLLPKKLFLANNVVEVSKNQPFLEPILIIVPLLLNQVLNGVKLISNLLLILEYVPKACFVPNLDISFNYSSVNFLISIWFYNHGW